MQYCHACHLIHWGESVCRGSGHHLRGGRCLNGQIDQDTDPATVWYKPEGSVKSVVGLKEAVSAANKDRLTQLTREMTSVQFSFAAAVMRVEELSRRMQELGDSIEHERGLG